MPIRPAVLMEKSDFYRKGLREVLYSEFLLQFIDTVLILLKPGKNERTCIRITAHIYVIFHSANCSVRGTN